MGSVSFTNANSPFDVQSVIDQLVELEREPIERYESRISEAQSDRGAFKDLTNRSSNLLDRVEELNDPQTLKQKKASSSDTEVLTASVTSSSDVQPGTFDVFVERLATAPSVSSGQQINDQKMVDTAHTGSDNNSATSISDFGVSGGDGLDVSSDYLDDLSKNVQTSGDGTEEFSITVDPGGADQFTVNVDLDDPGYSSFNDLINDVNSRLANNDPTNKQRLEFAYDEDADKFRFVPTEDGSDPGGTSFQLDDNEAVLSNNSEGFLQQIGIAEDETAHTFDERQSQFEEDGTVSPRNLVSIDPDTIFSSNQFTTALTSTSGTIEINNTQIDYDISTSTDDVSTINELVNRVNEQVEGVTANYNSATDKITLESDQSGSGEIDVSDVSGNLADVLNLRTESAATAGQSTGSETLGQDSKFKIDGDVVTSSTNTVEFNGMSLTAQKTHPDDGSNSAIEVTSSKDTASVADTVQKFVDQYNSVVDFINSKSEVEAPTEPGGDGDPEDSGPFVGDSTVRSFKNRMTSIVTSSYDQATSSGDDIQSLADIGLEIRSPLTTAEEDRGKLNFDKETFQEALEESPDQVREILTAEADDSSSGGLQDGAAVQLESILKGHVQPDGIFDVRQEGYDQQIQRLQDRIESTQRRVEAKRENLQREFGRMNELLGQLQNQQSFLAARL